MKKLITAVLISLTAISAFAQSKYTSKDLVWSDEFDGPKLDTKAWNYELHDPGWVNHEWQSYVLNKKNVYLKDGNLIIQPIKTVDSNGKVSYTSGRINTEHKNFWKYGRMEARIKMPKGQGIWPAFWMMPEDQELYGYWPRCGEIDISEVLGDNPYKTYSTIHYGLPHGQKQGIYEGEDLSADFHLYALEWEPGEMRYYVDDNLIVTMNDWYTKTPGYDNITYPAPFDQPFFIILNVAVGGDWPGYPDETTKFDETAQMQVDYVRVYQKKSYDENVLPPPPEAIQVVEDATGNMVRSGENNWSFLTFGGGSGNLKVSEDELTISSGSAGTLEYSVQVVQPNIGFEQGSVYTYSYDAWADSDRTIISCISQPEQNFTRIFNDTKVNLTKEKQHFEYTINMTATSDPHGRIEYNLGAQDSTATVHISNVRLEKTGTVDFTNLAAGTLPDGNFIRNGQFQEGQARLGNWETTAAKGGKISVTNDGKIRELKIESKKVKSISDMQVIQKGISIPAGTDLILRFDARVSKAGKISVQLGDISKTFTLSTENQKYEFCFTTDKAVKNADFIINAGNSNQTVYIDNVTLKENILIANGKFEQNMSGYEVYAHSDASESHSIVSDEDGNAFQIKINNTATMDWAIQLMQRHIPLIKGQKYKLSFKAKSDLDRTIMFALQRDGSNDDNWTPYSDTIRIDLTKDYQTFEREFVMDYDSDDKAMLSISMGAVNNQVINTPHTITIDSIELVMEKAPENIGDAK